jgi:menaquinone-dependent protoporphyrinogen IX oxidase
LSKILVAYTTNAGSTAETAETLANHLRTCGHSVDLARVESRPAVEGYDAVIVGAPMILGWHRAALNFVRVNREALAQKPVAYFCTLMSLTQTPAATHPDLNIAVDPWLPKPPKNPARLGIKENYATLANYLRPLQKAAPAVRPISVAMLGGKLELFRLKWWQMLFCLVIIQAQPGDRRNPAFLKQWAGQVSDQLAGGS